MRPAPLNLCCLMALLIGLYTSAGLASQQDTPEARLRARLHSQDALLIMGPTGDVLFSQHAARPMVPASTLKIPTALFALETLGATYRFPLKITVDKNRRLAIKGYGDPLLISEVLTAYAKEAAQRLRDNGIKTISGVVVDGSWFGEIRVPGQTKSFEPYDAAIGAVIANFNTVNYRRTPEGHLESAEPQTPLLPFIKSRIPKEAPKGRIALSYRESRLYAGHLFAWFLGQHGIDVQGEVTEGPMPEAPTQIDMELASPFVLSEAVNKLMTYSNNVMANQIFLASGAKQSGPPASLEKSCRAFETWAVNRGLASPTLTIVEGSGLSRENRISAEAMARFLAAFTPWRHLLTRQKTLLFKTGTLAQVSTRAGFIETPKGLCRFVLFQNRKRANAAPLLPLIEALTAP